MVPPPSASSSNANGRRGTISSRGPSSSSSFLSFVSLLLRVIFWPLRRLTDLLFPVGEFDGLSPSVTERASRQFVVYLKELSSEEGSNNPNISNITTTTTTITGSSTTTRMISEAFSANSFSHLKQEALATQSLLLIYLHSPIHRQSKESCQKFLLYPPMLELLLTTQNNNNHHHGSSTTTTTTSMIKGGIIAMGSSIHTSQGLFLSMQLTATSYPCIALLQPSLTTTTSSSSSSTSNSRNGSDTTNRNTTYNNNNNNMDGKPMKLVLKAEGPLLMKLSSSQFFNLVMATYQKHQMTVQEREARRIEMEEEVELRRQQDQEYQEALLADQHREQEQRMEAERQERWKREVEEQKRKKLQDEQERLDNARALIRPEPEPIAGTTTRIRFQLPTGQKLDRRFENEDTIGALKAFLILHFAELPTQNDDDHHVIRNISLSTNFPKKTYDDDTKTLKECDLCPQAVILCHDLDA